MVPYITQQTVPVVNMFCNSKGLSKCRQIPDGVVMYMVLH